jgi:hypothetical protein
MGEKTENGTRKPGVKAIPGFLFVVRRHFLPFPAAILAAPKVKVTDSYTHSHRNRPTRRFYLFGRCLYGRREKRLYGA